MAAAYAKQKGVSTDAVRFLSPEGMRLDNKKTIEENGLEDGDVVEGRIEQHGGGRHGCARALRYGCVCVGVCIVPCIL